MAVKNTTLNFGLVTLDVALNKATNGAEPRFDRASASGNPIARREFDTVTGEQLDADNIVKGIRQGDNFHEIDADVIAEIERTAKEALPAIEVEEFVPIKDLPTTRIAGAYYLTPQKGSGSGEGLDLLLGALKRTKTAGLAKLVLRSREYLAAIYEQDGALILNTLAFADQFHPVQLEGAKPNREKLAMAVSLIESMKGEGKLLAEARDELIPERERLIQDALQGKPVKAPKAAAAKPKRDATMEALEASLAAQKSKVKA